MDSKERKMSKISRVLSIYHLFRFCREVSFKEVTDLMPVSKKTVERDILLLRAAGLLNIRFSKRAHAFVPVQGERMTSTLPPIFPESKAQQDSIKKIIRLVDMMEKMDEADDPIAWYRERYSTLSARTMQRDFKELRTIGYFVYYQADDPFDDKVHPMGSYYCEFPYSTYSLKTFQNEG